MKPRIVFVTGKYAARPKCCLIDSVNRLTGHTFTQKCNVCVRAAGSDSKQTQAVSFLFCVAASKVVGAAACVLNSARQLALGVLLASRFPIQVDENDFPGLCWPSCFEFPWLLVDTRGPKTTLR